MVWLAPSGRGALRPQGTAEISPRSVPHKRCSLFPCRLPAIVQFLESLHLIGILGRQVDHLG